LPGQRSITDFFAKKKSSADPSPYKKPLIIPFQSNFATEIEQITRKLRGDQVKILWMPKRHAEVDAARFITVFLLNEIARLTEIDDGVDLKHKCAFAIDRFPNDVWTKAVELVTSCEDFYLKSLEDGGGGGGGKDERTVVKQEEETK
jgi:hypothetical protein